MLDIAEVFLYHYETHHNDRGGHYEQTPPNYLLPHQERR